MEQASTALKVRRPTPTAATIDISGEITGASQEALTSAFDEAATDVTRVVIFNFRDLEYMNSSGIGLLVMVLIRANRQGQRLLAYGLNQHYREILNLTRLDEAIGIYDDEAAALAAGQ